MGVEVPGGGDEKRIRCLDLAQMKGLIGRTEHGICRLVAGGGAGLEMEPVRPKRSEGGPRISGTGAGCAPRGMGAIEQRGDFGRQLEELQLLGGRRNGKGHAPVELLGRHEERASRCGRRGDDDLLGTVNSVSIAR